MESVKLVSFIFFILIQFIVWASEWVDVDDIRNSSSSSWNFVIFYRIAFLQLGLLNLQVLLDFL